MGLGIVPLYLTTCVNVDEAEKCFCKFVSNVRECRDASGQEGLRQDYKTNSSERIGIRRTFYKTFSFTRSWKETYGTTSAE